MKRSARALLLCLSLASVVSAAPADRWPRLRGADGDGKAAPDADVPLTWGDAENLAWKTPLPGPGSSSPIVWEDKVFITCWSGYGDGRDGGGDVSKLVRHLVCLSLADGKILWDKTVPAAQPEDAYQGFITEHGYASNTPATDGENVYVFFGKSGALAFDMDGNQRWQTDLGKSSSNRRWGSAASPILYKDSVIVNASDESRAIYALDKKSGSQLWKAAGDTLELAYSTPILVKRDAGEDLVLAVPEELWGLNPDTGKLRWYAVHGLPGNISPGAVLGEGAIFVAGGFPQKGWAGFKLGGKGDITQSGRLWSVNESTYIPTPIYIDGRLHVVDDQGFAQCLDAKTGAVIYRERVMGGGGQQGGGGRRGGGGKPFYASPVLVGDKLICVSRRNGTFILSAGREFKHLGVNVISSDTSQFHGTPAVVGKRMILRSDQAAYCISAKS